MQKVKLFFAALFFLSFISCAHTTPVAVHPPELRDVAQAECHWTAPTHSLALIYPQSKASTAAPQVSFDLQGDILKANFAVVMDPRKINAKKKLGPNEYPYQYDVFEVFLNAKRSDDQPYPYYEFEVSPYNETFQVLIEWKDGKKKFTEKMNYGIKSSATITGTGWNAEIEIDLRKLNWQGQPSDVIGNAFAVIGKNPVKNYWSLNLTAQKKPNFHLPEFFKSLVTCQE